MRIVLTILVAVCIPGAVACKRPEAAAISIRPGVERQDATLTTATAMAVPVALPDLDAASPLAWIESEFVWPAGGTISTYFGSGHPNGIDIALSYGEESPIRASAEGKVVYAGLDCCVYGNHVIIEHKGGMKTLYAHLERLDVEAGETVQQGQVIGLGGSTGDATGKHLHFGLFDYDIPVDPLRYLPNAVVRTSAPCGQAVVLGPDSSVSLTINAPFVFADVGPVVADMQGVASEITRISAQEYRLEIPPVAYADGLDKQVSVALVASNGHDSRPVRCDLVVSTPRTFSNPIMPQPRHSAEAPSPQRPLPALTPTPQMRRIPSMPTPARTPVTLATPAKPKATPAPPLTFPLTPSRPHPG